jgi:hypothetical protein
MDGIVSHKASSMEGIVSHKASSRDGIVSRKASSRDGIVSHKASSRDGIVSRKALNNMISVAAPSLITTINKIDFFSQIPSFVPSGEENYVFYSTVLLF